MAKEWSQEDAERLYELVRSADLKAIKNLVEDEYAGALPENSWHFSLGQLWDCCLNGCDVDVYRYLESLGMTWDNVRKNKIENSWGELYDSLIDCCIVENKEKGADAIRVFLLAILEDGYKFIGSSVISGLDEAFELFGDDLEVLSALDRAKVPLCPEAYDPGTYGRMSYIAFWNGLLDRGLNDTVAFLVRRGYHLPDEISDDPRVAQFKSVEVDEDRRPRDLAEDVHDAKATMALDELKRRGLLSSSDGLKDGTLLLDERGVAVVPDGVRVLEEGAFAHNNELKAIALPSSLKRIAKGALSDLPKLEAVATYDSSPSDAKVESGVFWASSLEGVEDWPWALDGVDEYRFGSSLGDVVISEAQGGLFQTKRPAVTVAEGGIFSSLDGMLMDEGGKQLVYCPNENKLSPVASGFSIPEGVEGIYEGALKTAPFSEITIPSSVRKIGKSAFARMSLQSVSVPGTVEQFDESREADWTDDNQGIFAFCDAMQSASLGEGITRVPDAMFYGCNGLLECSLPSTLKSIGNDSFSNCRNLELVVPDACTDIHPKAFGSGILSSVRSVSLSERVSEETLAAVCSNANGALVMQRDGAGGYKNLIYLPDDNDDAEARPVLEAIWKTWEDGFAAGIKGQDEFFASGRLKRFYTKIRIAICRLASPYLLSDDAKKMYSDYLASGIDKAKRDLDCYEGAAFLKLLGLIDGYDAVEPSVSGRGVAESTDFLRFYYYEPTIGDDHERLDEIGMDAESFENAVRDAVWSMPVTVDVEGTRYLDRAEHIEAIHPGDPVVLASNWASPYGEECDIEVFDSRGRTLGLLGYCEHINNPILALMLPYTSARVSSVTPLSARRKNARNALLSIEIEVEDGLCDDVEEKAKPEVLLQLEALLDLSNEELVLLSKGNLKASDLKGALDVSQAIDELPEPASRGQEVQAMPAFAETDLSEGEPRYRDADGNFNGEALLWLLAEDYVFFNDTDFGWNGENNVVAGAQVNSPKKDEIPEFMSELSENATALVMLMRTLENDKQLRIDRGSIHSALYGAIREGDLTATTLINLVACSRAWRILVPSAVRDLEERGILPNIDEPAPGRVYTVSVDDRLARGIPNFYRLIVRLLWDMRKVNGDPSPFRVSFLTTKVLDYNPDLEQFEGSVDGAEIQPLTYIDVDEEPKVKFGLFDLLNAFAGEMGEAEEVPNDPKALSPTDTIANADEAKFTAAVPDGYKCVYNFMSPMGEKPFALLPEDMPDESEDGVQGHVAFQYVVMPDLGDEEMKSARETMFTPDLCIAFQRMMSCQQEAHLTSLQDRVVDGANCKCLVVLEKMDFFGAVYNVKIQVAQYDIHDYLRVDCAGMSLERAESVFELACQLAATISSKDPKECQVLRDARALLEKKVDGDEFERAFEALSTPLIKARQFEANSAHTNFCSIHDVYTTREEVFAQGEALQRWTEENVSYMELCYDAYQAQERLGASFAERKKMHAYLDEFAQHYHLNLGHEGEEWDVKAKAAGVLHVPERIAELEKKWKGNPPAEAAEGNVELLFAYEGQPVVSGGFTISKKDAVGAALEVGGSKLEDTPALRAVHEKAEQARREAEERAERERKEAEEKARKEEKERAERERKEAEERAEQERFDAIAKAIVAERVKGFTALVRVVRINSKTFDSAISEAENTLEKSRTAYSECEGICAKVELEKKAMSDSQAELKSLGLFAFGRKKELAADIEKREANLRQLRTALEGWQKFLGKYGLPEDAKGVVDKLVKQKEEALAAEKRARFDQASAPELVTVKPEEIAEELVDEDENEIGFSYIGTDGVKRECYYAEDENARRERRGFSYGDLADPKVLGLLGKKYTSVFAELESDPVAGPVIRATAELKKYTAEGRRAQEAEKEAQATSAAARENERLAKEVLMWMPEDRPVLTSEIMEHISGIMTSQKCTKVMDVLIEAGKVERVDGVRGRYIGYRIRQRRGSGYGDRSSGGSSSWRSASNAAAGNSFPSSNAGAYSGSSSSHADSRSTVGGRAAKENERLAKEVLVWMPCDRPVLTSEIMENVNGIMTSQKCSKVMDVLIEAGKVEKVYGVKGRYIGYQLL